EVDFYLATESTVTFREPAEPYRVPLSSSSFINEAFYPAAHNHKIWDVITVTHNGKNKRMRDFILAVRKLYDRGKKYRILLLNKKSAREPGKNFDNGAIDLYYELFSTTEQQNFVMMRLSDDMSFLGMPSQTVADFMRLSKVFALFSEQEGEPRVVAEALICGLPVVAYRHIKAGGSIDHLTDDNSVRFADYPAAAAALEEAVEHHDRFRVDAQGLAEKLREDYTIETFKDYLAPLYEREGQVFDRRIEHGKLLANAVNAHLVDVPWGRGRLAAADVLSREQFGVFF
ncbi:MAG: glycosyltransferase, partial [Bacteroidota bacterium]